MKLLAFLGTDGFFAGVSALGYNLSIKNSNEKFRKKNGNDQKYSVNT
jgi:hypothetical protein